MVSLNDRVFIFGGYDMDPLWLQSGIGYEGVVEKMSPHGVLVRLDAPLTLKGVTGNHLYLSNRYADSTDFRHVHVVLCAEVPESKPDIQDTVRFAWVESHAGMVTLDQETGLDYWNRVFVDRSK